MAGNTLLEQNVRQACIDFKVSPENTDMFVLSVIEAIDFSFGSRTALDLCNVTVGYMQIARKCKADITLDEDRFAEAVALTADRYLAELSALARGGI